MAEHIPEDVIVKIFQRLPIKSLIRFTSLSKRWRFIILRDRQFATSQYQIASDNNKSVCFRTCFDFDCEFFKSLNLQTTTSALTNLRCPFKQPNCVVFLYSSCRGLVFASFNSIARYIWNPSTGFFKKLPDPGVQTEFQVFTGFGYISATDEYKILIATSKRGKKGEGAKIRIFSSKSNSWKRIQDSQYFVLSTTFDGTLLNEALHWLRRSDVVIVAFDLADEEFRTMPLPVVEDHYAGGYFRHLGDFGGCLCVFGQADTNAGSMDLWVMREYDAGNSWTKLFNLKFSDQPEQINFVKPIWVMETSTFMEVRTNSERDPKWVRSYHKEEKIEEIHMKENIFKDIRTERESVIGYEESLLWLE
ncbi:F-box protein CPR1-like [Rosa rugosa]|uniref:F-box protein CPR1-like n=1 Tax=Rosa rugosa TaxID=74645 RepID=UPI002B408C2A|nr:F-box protein CPR1-like [Rosa rugosa]XP_062016365.1 F-box protein CPR1-like [Rosa rugosa]